jgi:hypothetical protein
VQNPQSWADFVTAFTLGEVTAGSARLRESDGKEVVFHRIDSHQRDDGTPDTRAAVMKHAGEAALNQLEDLLIELRRIPGLKEQKRGVFYRGRRPFSISTKTPRASLRMCAWGRIGSGFPSIQPPRSNRYLQKLRGQCGFAQKVAN